jgi:8-oxo-dGTP pyrophosphatase MutT (NUDIX family)
LAVTLIVARPLEAHDDRFEVLLCERGRGAFARGLWVFPGGRVDPEDTREDLVGDSIVREVADRFGLPLGRAAALVVGAVRELAEETAIARPGPSAFTLDETSWRAVRAGSFAFDMPSGPLWSLARWLPPRFEMRRFDTYFLACEVPAGTEARADGDELRAHRWLTPARALEAFAQGTLPLLPPTYRSLAELAAFPTLGALREAFDRHWPPVNAPTVRPPTEDEGGVVVTELGPGSRPGLDGTTGHAFRFDGERWTPLRV